MQHVAAGAAVRRVFCSPPSLSTPIPSLAPPPSTHLGGFAPSCGGFEERKAVGTERVSLRQGARVADGQQQCGAASATETLLLLLLLAALSVIAVAAEQHFVAFAWAVFAQLCSP